MAYSTDADLVKIRPNIMSLGVSAWTDQHNESTAIINRALLAWYNTEATKRGYADIQFDSSKILNASTQLKRLACYKTLELAYMYLMVDGVQEGGFRNEMTLFRELYEREFNAVLESGIDYDWDDDGAIDDYEATDAAPRRLVRV